MGFAMFFIAEYSAMITASALVATLFFGGWDIPFTTWDNVAPWSGLKTLVTFVSFFAKVLFFLFLFIWIRWTVPRFRYDQLMSLGWKVMLPLALAYIVIVASAILGLEAAGVARGPLYGAILFGINLVLLVLLVLVLDRGRLVSPASPRARLAEVARLRAEAHRRREALLRQAGSRELAGEGAD
jgi:NADH-quinone oxidoreductase subunit H